MFCYGIGFIIVPAYSRPFVSHAFLCFLLCACSTTGNRSTPSPPVQQSNVIASSSDVFSLVQGFQTKLHSRAGSKGVIYYFGGHSDGRPTPVDDNIVPPYLRSLNASGWNVFRANPEIQYRNNDDRQLLADDIIQFSLAAKESGYNRVALIGQSFGSWNIMLAAEEPAFDKFVAIAPACCGLAEENAGADRQPWKDRMLRIVPMARSAEVPGVVFLFKEDEFYVPEIAEAVARERYRSVSVVDRPPGFIGHGSAWLDAFRFAYAKCLDVYLSSPASHFRCDLPELQNIVRSRQDIIDNGGRTLSSTALRQAIVGNTIAGNAAGEIVNLYFPTSTTMIVETRSGYDRGKTEVADYWFENDKICSSASFFGEQCYEVLKWPTGLRLFAITPNEAIAFEGNIIDGNQRNLQMAEK